MKQIEKDIKNIFREGWHACLVSMGMPNTNQVITDGRCEVDWECSAIKLRVDQMKNEVQPPKKAANDRE